AVLVLTKPVSRGAFVIAKYVAQATMLIVATCIGTLVCWGITHLTFSTAPFERLASSTAAWLAFALLLLAVMTVLSSAFKALAAGGLGIGVFFVLSILPLWDPALRYSPAGLGSAPNALLVGEAPELLWPIATAAISIVVLVTAAVMVFSRREI
ncbi:MAG: ABC transporter permease subunit, partial [Coriobacteriia bacterium]